ncbi:hypothetical protein [Variovorax sp. LG9.2]|uniref:hypothetical protein n=1 Tax=Variovorax sp. LG9.2 TaxID=3048626 RepID=UPI002B22A921|nr:hypothetical protein [Variovorax sp. LG9.2]MEB0056720.1 hypothetical protein [Variovorax sp. LG9.2]
MRLTLTTYEPNFNDPRVRRRVTAVLDWCSHHLSEKRAIPVHHDVLHRVFGNATNQLTKFLRANLLVLTGSYQPGKSSYSYLRKQIGFDKLLHSTQHMVATSAIDSEPELRTLKFEYSLKSDRYFHRLQQLPSGEKKAFWADYLPFDYDIEACAPTVLFQLARRAGLCASLLLCLQSYLHDKAILRKHVMELTGLSMKESKRLINSLFNGARLARSRYCAIFRMLRCDRAAMESLQSCAEIRRLRWEIALVWNRLEQIEQDKESPTTEGLSSSSAPPCKRRFKTGSQKWCFYFSQERKILDAIVDELSRAGVRHFTEHDGFRTDRPVDARMVEGAVFKRTGFSIKLKSESNWPGAPYARAR